MYGLNERVEGGSSSKRSAFREGKKERETPGNLCTSLTLSLLAAAAAADALLCWKG